MDHETYFRSRSGGAAGRAVRGLLVRINAVAALMVASACATAGSTLGSGVGDRLIKDPPYAAGRSVLPGEFSRIAHLPISYQRGSMQEPIFDPAGRPGSAVSRLLAEMNHFLGSLGASVPIAILGAAGGTPPDVWFSCEQDRSGKCASESREISVQAKPGMRLAVGRPSASWVLPVRAALREAGADGVLVISLEVGQYWTHRRNLRGSKEVRLGAGHSASVPWMTALDQPVQVLQLTGALVDVNGRAVRIGAEGILAQPTNLLLSSFGAQEVVTEADVERVLELRRRDLPDQPLVWQVALRSLVGELTGARFPTQAW